MKTRIVLTVILFTATFGALSSPVSAEHGNAAEVFEATWQRTDLPVLTNVAERTWIWGPEPVTEIMHEKYAESEDGVRSVQYYDKSRMEVTDANGDQNSIWYVTNGLLVIELMSGRMQVGDNAFVNRSPAGVNVAGDADDPFGPTYRTISEVAEEPAASVGETLVQRLSRSGTISIDASLENQGIQVAVVAGETGHSIAQPFWDFMNSSGTIFTNDEFTTDSLFENPYFATGYPVSEPYWADVSVGGETKLVLLQCFERRCLTYTPDNAPEWRVEAGNVGLHYLDWRYASTPPPSRAGATDCDPGRGSSYADQWLIQPSFIARQISCAVFTGTTIAQGNDSEADLSRADFSGADLQQPIFRNTTLDEAIIVGATLDLPMFTGATAIDANFADSSLSQPILQNTSLLGAVMATAAISMPQFNNTVCLDSTNSNDNGGTCMDHLESIPPAST